MAKKKVFSINSSLSAGLEQTISAAQNYANELRIDVIPLTKIELDPENPRDLSITINELFYKIDENDPDYTQKIKDKESLQSLANSIKDQGIINPILVYEHNHLYRLIAGERRTLASILAGKTDIQAKIIDSNPNELKIRILQWIENIERSDLSLKERIDNLEKILDAYAQTNNINIQDIRITDISQLIGCTKSHAINLKLVLFAKNDIKKYIAENKIRSLEKAAILSSIQSDELREQAITECIKGASLITIKKFLDVDKNDSHESIKKVTIKNHTAIKLGSTTRPIVAQAIIESVINHLSLDHISLKELNYDSPQSIAKTFKSLISHLESIYE